MGDRLHNVRGFSRGIDARIWQLIYCAVCGAGAGARPLPLLLLYGLRTQQVWVVVREPDEGETRSTAAETRPPPCGVEVEDHL